MPKPSHDKPKSIPLGKRMEATIEYDDPYAGSSKTDPVINVFIDFKKLAEQIGRRHAEDVAVPIIDIIRQKLLERRLVGKDAIFWCDLDKHRVDYPEAYRTFITVELEHPNQKKHFISEIEKIVTEVQQEMKQKTKGKSVEANQAEAVMTGLRRFLGQEITSENIDNVTDSVIGQLQLLTTKQR